MANNIVEALKGGRLSVIGRFHLSAIECLENILNGLQEGGVEVESAAKAMAMQSTLEVGEFCWFRGDFRNYPSEREVCCIFLHSDGRSVERRGSVVGTDFKIETERRRRSIRQTFSPARLFALAVPLSEDPGGYIAERERNQQGEGDEDLVDYGYALPPAISTIQLAVRPCYDEIPDATTIPESVKTLDLEFRQPSFWNRICPCARAS